MGEKTDITFTGDSASLEAAFKRLQEENAKLKAGFSDTAKVSKAANKDITESFKELDRVAKHVRESTKTDAEKQIEYMAKVRASYTMGKISAEEYARALKSIQKPTQEVTSATGSFVSAGLSGLASMATGWISISTAIQAANFHMQESIRLQQEAASRTVTAGNAMEGLAINMGGDVSPELFRSTISGLQGAAQGTRLTSADALMRGAAGAVSSLGESDPKKRAARVIAMAQAIAPLASDTTAEGLMTMVAQSGQVTGAQTAEDFRRILALGAGAQGMSSVTGFDAMKHAARAGADSLAEQDGKADKGKGYQEAMAIWAAVTTARKDITGERSATAVQGMAAKLRTFFGANNLKGGTFMERLQFLQQNKPYADAFTASLGDGSDSGLWRTALDPNSDFARSIAGNVANIRPDEAAIATISANLAATSPQQTASVESLISAARNRSLENQPKLTKREQIRQALKLLAPTSGVPIGEWIEQKGYDWTVPNNTNAELQFVREAVQGRAEYIEGRHRNKLMPQDEFETNQRILQDVRDILNRIAAQGEQANQMPNSDAARAQPGMHREGN